MKSISTPILRKILLGLFVVMIGLNAYQVWRIAFVRHEADFPAYLAGAHAILTGTNPYIPTTVAPYNNPPYNTPETFRPFIYPLFVAWLWVPFALLPPIVASLLWYFISVAIFFVVLRLLTTLLGINDERQRLLFYGALTLLSLSVIQADEMFGQMNMLVLFLLLLGVKYVKESPIKSGLGFGAAIAAKFMPIVLLPVIALKNIRVSLLTVVTIFLLAFAIPFLIAGSHIIEYYQYWFQSTLSGEITQGNHGVSSFDLASVLAQTFGMNYPTTLMRAICGFVLLIFPLILIKKGSNLAGYFLAFMLLPLTASRSEPAHLVILMPAMGLLVAHLLKTKATAWPWLGLLALQLMILWGFNKAIPFDTVGMLVLFGIVFAMGTRFSNEPVVQKPLKAP